VIQNTELYLQSECLLGNAVLDNFEQDIGITPDQFNTCVTIFYVCVCVCITRVFYLSQSCVGWIFDLSNTKQYITETLHCQEMVRINIK